jgi:hypothetical protein
MSNENNKLFDDALEWCISYNIEIDPLGGDGKGTHLTYHYLDTSQGICIDESVYAESLEDAVAQMKKKIGEKPIIGYFR